MRIEVEKKEKITQQKCRRKRIDESGLHAFLFIFTGRKAVESSKFQELYMIRFFYIT